MWPRHKNVGAASNTKQNMETNKPQDFLYVLKLLSFDDFLFRKEFLKTLSWLGQDHYAAVYSWMISNRLSTRFPDLMKIIAL